MMTLNRSSMFGLTLALPLIGIAPACGLTDNGTNDTGADDGTGETGGSAGTEGGTGPAQTVTIFDIQQGMVAEGSIVTLQDVVISSPVNVEEGGVFVQDQAGGEFSGIYLFMYTEIVDGLPLAPGDVVTLTGEYTEFYEMSEVTVKSLGEIEVVGNVAPPAPAVVAAADIATGGPLAENYEGVLVSVEGVTVDAPVNQYGEFTVDGGLVIDDYFLLDAENKPEPNPGAVYDVITGPLFYGFEQFRVLPRTIDDLVGGEGGITAEPRTIYEIQQGMVAENSPVIVEQVVVTSPLTFKGDTFFVQERDGGEYSGIPVFVHDEQGLQVQVGDVVTLEGVYQEYYDQSQVVLDNPGDIEVIEAGEPLMPELVDAAAIATGGASQENYEGVLVRVEGVTVDQAPNTYGEFTLDGSLIVDDLFFTMGAGPQPQAGQMYTSISGVMTYDFEEAKLAPRDLQDLVQ
jgi:predicted extracellular nuclease